MTVYQITPNPNCRWCHGSGEIYERHPYGSGSTIETLTCSCVDDQLPEEFNPTKDEVDIITEHSRIIVNDSPEFEYDDLF